MADTDRPLHQIMRNRVGKRSVRHPLWGNLIKGDNKGYYWFSGIGPDEENILEPADTIN